MREPADQVEETPALELAAPERAAPGTRAA
jgi:hypothetical protein